MQTRRSVLTYQVNREYLLVLELANGASIPTVWEQILSVPESPMVQYMHNMLSSSKFDQRLLFSISFPISLALTMEFVYSMVVDPSTYSTEGLCEGIPLRKHMDPCKENIGAVRAQQDWAKFVRPLSQYRGGLGPEYSFIRVTVPECLPDRLEIIAYANEFAFLYDGTILPH